MRLLPVQAAPQTSPHVVHSGMIFRSLRGHGQGDGRSMGHGPSASGGSHLGVSKDLYELGLRHLRVASPLRHTAAIALAERCFSEASSAFQRGMIVQTALSPEGAAARNGTETWQLCAYNEAWLEDLLRCSASPLGVAANLCIVRQMYMFRPVPHVGPCDRLPEIEKPHNWRHVRTCT